MGGGVVDVANGNETDWAAGIGGVCWEVMVAAFDKGLVVIAMAESERRAVKRRVDNIRRACVGWRTEQAALRTGNTRASVLSLI